MCNDPNLSRLLREITENLSKLSERSVNQDKWINETLNELKALRQDVNSLFNEVDKLKQRNSNQETRWEQWSRVAGYLGLFFMSITVVAVEFFLRVD